MGKESDIQYCDSTVNGEMGCDGCELWTGDIRRCYAGTLTELRKGHKGFPAEFTTPELFTKRFADCVKWKDLTGLDRVDKSWLNGYPRIIFQGDMGDYWTESLPIDWLLPYFELLESSPHIHLFLTKRPHRMLQTFKLFGRVPRNFWLGTSITNQETAKRQEAITNIKHEFDCVNWISYEPNVGNVHFTDRTLEALDWLVTGGESDQEQPARPMDFFFLRKLLAWLEDFSVARFVKQLGSVWAKGNFVYKRDMHGGDWSLWPQALKIREMPQPKARPESQINLALA